MNSQLGELGARGSHGAEISLLDLPVDLVSVNREMAGRFDADLDNIIFNPSYPDLDIIADHDALIKLSAKNQHGAEFKGSN